MPLALASCLEQGLHPRTVTTSELIYDHCESQSGRHLPIIYEPFDPTRCDHFVDRAQVLDYALATRGGRVLDFGPGDGWPSLPLAAMVRQVIGVDGSRRRVDVCADNARRLGVRNARFVYVPPGQPLPFDDHSFDTVVASSALEQTPDPRQTLAEIHRVLTVGGRLRLNYESLAYYLPDRCQSMSLWALGPQRTMLLVYDRLVEKELVRQYRLMLALSADAVAAVFRCHGQEPSASGLTSQVLAELSPSVTDAAMTQTRHPSCRTWLAWMNQIGFRAATPTHSGGRIARRLFDQRPPHQRQAEVAAIDRWLTPIVRATIELPAPPDSLPGQWDPMITAVK